jgi:hypothetical protein
MKPQPELEREKTELREALDRRRKDLQDALKNPDSDPTEVEQLRLMVSGLTDELGATELELGILADTPIPTPRRRQFRQGRFVTTED